FFLVRLIVVSRAGWRSFRIRRQSERNNLLCGRNLRDHRLEPREKQSADVELAGLVQRNDLAADRVGIVETDRANRTQIDHFDDLASELPAQDVMPFFADTKDFDRLALPYERHRRLAREPRDRGIKSAAKTALGGADDQEMDRVAAATEQARNMPARPNRGGEIGQNLVQPLGVGSRRFSRQ